MAKEPLLPPTEKTAQPQPNETHKDQKAYQLGPDYDPRAVNQLIDQIHARINTILRDRTDDGELIEDLATDGTATNAQICTRLNLITEIMREVGLIRRSE